jgi:hypothetical protein
MLVRDTQDKFLWFCFGPFWTLVIWSLLYDICFEQICDAMFAITDLSMQQIFMFICVHIYLLLQQILYIVHIY